MKSHKQREKAFERKTAVNRPPFAFTCTGKSGLHGAIRIDGSSEILCNHIGRMTFDVMTLEHMYHFSITE
jgi:hypothetical protein